MKSLKEQFIGEVVGEAVRRAAGGRPVRVLDLGCGTASYAPALVAQFPTIEYIGIEPIADSFAAAEKNLSGVPNAKVHFQLGYDVIPNEADASFDLVFSLSVLEHIKQLERFIALGAKYTRSGGLTVHRYDLGHALYPHTLKERLHVWMGNTIPQVLPERQFVRYVPEAEVRAVYEKCGVTPIATTYHQMPNFKTIEKLLKNSNSTVVAEAFAWEMKHQDEWRAMNVKERELLFPAVAVWGEKSPGDFSQDLAS